MAIRYKLHLSWIMFIIVFHISCSGGEMEQKEINQTAMKSFSNELVDKLSKKKIFFGHHSVGNNILDGLRRIIKENQQIDLDIVNSNDAGSLTPGTLVHAKVGQNKKPITKINEFKKMIDNGIGTTADAAGFKFCYIDIHDKSDTSKLFSLYQLEIERIKKTYQDLTIIHFTLPLTVIQTGPKAWVKNMLGRSIGVKENMKRHEYNQLLRAQYGQNALIFDIAQIESTHADGTRSVFKIGDKTYYSMAKEYTDDGEHLNSLGKKKAAEQFIQLLSKI